ncbi:hypothetical protein [Thermoflavifilum aggregans]|uniref:hypothetical protein n=1 Tax=Thermoflavifilum aggregans TaxID=454188 RepID=UPI0012FE9D1B|nr:hypothetical protein [Thermoflavifilum aggregans]
MAHVQVAQVAQLHAPRVGNAKVGKGRALAGGKRVAAVNRLPATAHRGQEAEQATLAALAIGTLVGQAGLLAVDPLRTQKVNHGAGRAAQAAVVDHRGKDGHRIVGENKQLRPVRHIHGKRLGMQQVTAEQTKKQYDPFRFQRIICFLLRIAKAPSVCFPKMKS